MVIEGAFVAIIVQRLYRTAPVCALIRSHAASTLARSPVDQWRHLVGEAVQWLVIIGKTRKRDDHIIDAP
jgi:hypothetical protein